MILDGVENALSFSSQIKLNTDEYFFEINNTVHTFVHICQGKSFLVIIKSANKSAAKDWLLITMGKFHSYLQMNLFAVISTFERLTQGLGKK